MTGRGLTIRRCIKALCVVVLLVAADLLLGYLIIPYGGGTQAVWYRYGLLANKNIDTLVVGSSYVMQGVNGERVDEVLGSRTSSLATPGQSQYCSLRAIQDAYEDHHIKRVVVGVSIESMRKVSSKVEYDVAFALGEALESNLAQGVRTYQGILMNPKYYGTSDSWAAIMPWAVWNSGLTPSAIMRNAELRNTVDPVKAYGITGSMGATVTECGFSPVPGTVYSYDMAPHAVSVSDDDYVPSGESLEGWRNICRYCADHDIDVYFVTPPWLEYLLLRYEHGGGYALAIKPFVDAVTAEGAMFLDCALLRPEYYQMNPGDFYNDEHLNKDGANRFSTTLGDLIKRSEAGENVSAYFFDHTEQGWREYQSSVDHLVLGTFYPTVENGQIMIEMKSWQGAGIIAEYEVTQRLDDGSYKVLRPYATDDTYRCPTNGHGTMTIRVNARPVGGGDDSVRYCEREILY